MKRLACLGLGHWSGTTSSLAAADFKSKHEDGNSRAEYD